MIAWMWNSFGKNKALKIFKLVCFFIRSVFRWKFSCRGGLFGNPDVGVSFLCWSTSKRGPFNQRENGASVSRIDSTRNILQIGTPSFTWSLSWLQETTEKEQRTHDVNGRIWKSGRHRWKSSQRGNKSCRCAETAKYGTSLQSTIGILSDNFHGYSLCTDIFAVRVMSPIFLWFEQKSEKSRKTRMKKCEIANPYLIPTTNELKLQNLKDTW